MGFLDLNSLAYVFYPSTWFSRNIKMGLFDFWSPFWLGGKPTTITLISSQTISVIIESETIAASSLLEVIDRQVEFSINHEEPQFLTVSPGPLKILIALQPGKNTVTL